jgi:AraC-like DNA-binding protein
MFCLTNYSKIDLILRKDAYKIQWSETLMLHKPSCRGLEEPLPSVSFTNRHLRAADQFEAYRADAIGFAELFQRDTGAACPASYTAWSLGSVVIKRTSAPALDQHRSAAMARRDGLDHWMINLPMHSRQRVELDGNELQVSAARPFLSSCHQPYRLERDGAENDWLICFIARDALPGLAPRPGMNGADVLGTPMGGLLTAYLRQMGARLPELATAELGGLRDATLALMRATLASSIDHREAARPHAEAILRDRIRSLIRSRLGAATLTPHWLSREVGMSRSALYRLMEPMGGVAAAIHAERLAQVRRGLENPDETRSIKDLAEAAGFFDASGFTRSFRRRYAATPREWRDAARAGLPNAAPHAASSGFVDLLAVMEA